MEGTPTPFKKWAVGDGGPFYLACSSFGLEVFACCNFGAEERGPLCPVVEGVGAEFGGDEAASMGVGWEESAGMLTVEMTMSWPLKAAVKEWREV